jgi:hypothetical protein
MRHSPQHPRVHDRNSCSPTNSSRNFLPIQEQSNLPSTKPAYLCTSNLEFAYNPAMMPKARLVRDIARSLHVGGLMSLREVFFRTATKRTLLVAGVLVAALFVALVVAYWAFDLGAVSCCPTEQASSGSPRAWDTRGRGRPAVRLRQGRAEEAEEEVVSCMTHASISLWRIAT